jgi:DNA-binding FadR family transcriptional regulator
MRISFDWPQIYGALVSQSTLPPKHAFAAARQIENDIYEEGWPAGEVFGDQASLIRRYGFSRATLREGVRLLEDRRVAHMRRGPGGGLVILPVARSAISLAVADHFIAAGVAADQVKKARAVLEIIAAYRRADAEGADACRAFTQEFRSRLAAGPGAGLLDPGSWTGRATASTPDGHVFTDLLAACLDAIDGRASVAGACPSKAPCELNQGRAHALARKIMLDLRAQGAVAAGTQRVGTEDQLCERHQVGREVLRQAIRVLESRGLIDSKRGRTHGLHAGASAAAAVVELVVAYLSSTRLSWRELEGVAGMLSRIVRAVVTAESTPQQRRELLGRINNTGGWGSSPSLITAQLRSEWAIAANPLLIFMEQCAAAYCARSSAAIWTSFDDSELPPMNHLNLYVAAAAEGNLVLADRIVESVCTRVGALRARGTFN